MTKPLGYKLRSLDELAVSLEAERSQGKTIVFTNGCFDLLHIGHLTVLTAAKALGDVLVVGLNGDASVRRIKGPARPVIGETDRAAILSALEVVDYVVLFDEATPQSLIEWTAPDVLVKGADWRGRPVAGQAFVEGRGGRVEFVELAPGWSTTALVARMEAKAST